MSVVLATRQPLPRPPMTQASGTRTSVMNTSLNIARPVISLSGRTSMPGWSMSMTKNVMPSCLGTSTEVRAMRIPHLENCAPEVHTFCPLTI